MTPKPSVTTMNQMATTLGHRAVAGSFLASTGYFSPMAHRELYVGILRYRSRGAF